MGNIRKNRSSRKKSRTNLVYNEGMQKNKTNFIQNRFNVYSNKISIKPSSSGSSHDQREYDTIGCSMISHTEVNKWWIDLVNTTQMNGESLRSIFLARYRYRNPAEPIIHTGINVMCLDRIVDRTDEKIRKILNATTVRTMPITMPTIEPGLNILISCYSSAVAAELNKHSTYGNSKGYYYMGFDGAIFLVNNVILMPDKKFEYKFVDFSTNNISDSLTEKIKTRLNNFRDNILTSVPPATYFTKADLVDKIATIANAVRTGTDVSNKMAGVSKKDGTVFTTMDKFRTDIVDTEIDPTNFIRERITMPILAKSSTSPAAPAEAAASAASSASSASSAAAVSTESSISSASSAAAVTPESNEKTRTRKRSRSYL